MSKLIVLSNRISMPSGKASAGGLAVAVQDALNDSNGIWLGWNGQQITDSEAPEFAQAYSQGIDYITCPLTHQQYAQYYCGFANKVLWPAMHHRDDLIEYDAEEYNTYQKVNRLFAQKLKELAQPEDLIWVHDYHFFSVARYCRELGMQNKIGFFLHIPFASLNIWHKIPVARELIQDLSQYDVIGLQTQIDQNACMQTCLNLLEAQKIQSNSISYKKRQILIKSYPIGVQPELIQKQAQQDLATSSVFNFEEIPRQKTIIGVDRIDYSKGLLERFNAFATFLETSPEYHGLVRHLQVAIPSRTDIPAYQRLYQRFKTKLELINEEFAHEDWRPVDCCYDTVQHHNLMHIYRHSDICWISSLRDGMNLVAKEYIAAQDPENPGVLILSKYAGAAEQMSQALIVDPQDRAAMMDTLKMALEMSKAERINRYQQLIEGLTSSDLTHWRNNFLDDLEKTPTLLMKPQRLLQDNYQSIYQVL
ncbi:trehalose-6-phosphate synthase [Acinetobacter pittii]|uniref:alpha,alpha-trehalose-phosphate synthase (UDP-forming) n=1 Tax=Acinetobacter pittii TaxID=48296 RepID=UPI002955C900|nr:trehalose-6-phosphate synthase [Acinetobacter pittii]MDV7706349.1 trehalose-6-phosphate synthase [Acinetobacter pittii]MDV7761287.1 trehalose-6-phosphate synthase [Acinetobacter pittii]MDX8164020.1 trehalose-6-phosphate synthase [Acinetobacter pittii]